MEENEILQVPQWHKQELDKRYKDYQQGNDSLYNWETVHENLRNEKML